RRAGTTRFTAPVTSLGASLKLDGSGTVELSGGRAITVPRLDLINGTLKGSDDLTVSGPLTWTYGTMVGPGRTVVQGGMTIGGTMYLDGRRLVNANEGTTTWGA